MKTRNVKRLIGFKTLSIVFLCLFATKNGQAQTYDPTMANNYCGGTYPMLFNYQYLARGSRNLITNGNFNIGSACTPINSTSYSYWGITQGGQMWYDTYTPSWTYQPWGIPTLTYNIVPWNYNMYWKSGSIYAQGTNIYDGHMYINMYQKSVVNGIMRNYILIELTKALQVGTSYTFEADFNTYNAANFNTPPSDVNLQMDRIGFALTDSFPVHVQYAPLLLTPFYETPKDSIIGLANHHVNMTVVGNGEKYIIIGNFHENDSIAFNATPNINSHSTYAFDLLKLYDPNCDNYGNVFLYEDKTNCVGSVTGVSSQHGISPYTWILDGDTLLATTSNISVIMPSDTSTLIVQSGAGNCISSDSILLIPKYYDIDLIQDTTLFCNWDVDLTPIITPQGGAQSSIYFNWHELQAPTTSISNTLNTTISTAGTYVFEVIHGNCHDFDTVQVNNNIGILSNLLPETINSENCINMNDGKISYDTSAYPTGVHFYWTPALVASDDPILDSLSSSVYQYYIFDDSNRCSYQSSFVDLVYDSCSIIKGRIYSDTNLNCTLDSLEKGIPNITVYSNPLNNFSVSDSLGNFEILVPPGTYSIQQNLSNNSVVGLFCPDPLINVPVSGLTLDSNFIGDTIHQFFHNPVMQGLTMTTLGLVNPFATCTFNVANMGDSLDNITVGLYVDHPVLNYFIQGPNFTGMTGDTALYTFNNINSFTTLFNSIIFSVSPNVNYIGDTVNIYAFCFGSNGDIDTTDNKLLQQRIILAAFDPNVKFVTPLGSDNQFRTKVEEREFTYTIHFQNTGNAPANNVLITDTISTVLDLSTFEIMSSSHDMVASSYNQVVSFEFNSINLPDSTSNEPDSKGYVQFKIKSVTSAYVGDTIINSANIYFDNNPPIITPNTTNIYFKPSVLLDTLAEACEGMVIMYNGNTYDSTGYYLDTLFGYYTDTIYAADVLIHSIDTVATSFSLCLGDSLNFYGNYIHNPGAYSHTLMNQNGCDSIEVLNVSLTNVDTSVSIISPIELYANANNHSYQWYDCFNNQLMNGATNQNFQPFQNGTYAVIIDDGICQDTSSCYIVSTIGLLEKNLSLVLIKPNPTNGEIFITGGEKIELFDPTGKQLFLHLEGESKNWLVNISNYANGVYFFKVDGVLHRIIKL